MYCAAKPSISILKITQFAKVATPGMRNRSKITKAISNEVDLKNIQAIHTALKRSSRAITRHKNVDRIVTIGDHLIPDHNR